jgi:hypothetical protein
LGYWRRADERERGGVQELQNDRGTLFGEERNSELRSSMGKRAWRFETLTRDVIFREVQRRELE